jgi:thymidylate kinase
MEYGYLVSIIGIDGSGKSTLLEEARACLPRDGYRCHEWRNPPLPGASGFLDIAAIKSTQVMRLTPHCRAALISGILAQQYETVLLPALQEGYCVITDGYPYKLWAKERVFGKSAEWLYWALAEIPSPDLVICLDTPPEIAFQRKTHLSCYEYRHTPTREDFSEFQTEIYWKMISLAKNASKVVYLPWELSPKELAKKLSSLLSEGFEAPKQTVFAAAHNTS